MTTQPSLALGHRLVQVLAHLGIERAHFATRSVSNLGDLPATHPEAIVSLTLLGPAPFAAAALAPLRSEVLLIRGDKGPSALNENPVFQQLPAVTRHVLQDYEDLLWADTAAERAEEVTAAVLGFLARVGEQDKLPPIDLGEREGEVAGLTYHTRGSGTPLMLLPLHLAASQWDPILPALGAGHCVIVLGGRWLDPIALLETRAQSDYSSMVFELLGRAGFGPGGAVLEVGCGSGALVRRLAAMAGGASSVTGMDINHYLLGEAAALARSEGLEKEITFREGSALALPFDDSCFDLTFSSTVMEEVDADRMLAEMVRVTKTGGMVAAVVRAVDRPQWVQLPLGPKLLAKVQEPGWAGGTGGGVAEQGCADASLYQRFTRAGLAQVKGYPHLVTVGIDEPWGRMLEVQNLGRLDAAEVQEWREAAERARTEGMLPWITRPFHCVIGTKP